MEVNTYCEVNEAGHLVYNNPIQQLAVRVPLAGYWLTQKNYYLEEAVYIKPTLRLHAVECNHNHKT